jgi:hypothetical protein
MIDKPDLHSHLTVVVKEEDKEKIQKDKKISSIYSIVLVFICTILGCILLSYIVFIQEEVIVINENSIRNMQQQQHSLQNHLQKLNPLQIVKNYQAEQKRKIQENFVVVIEKLQPKLSPSMSKMIANSLLNECDKKNIDENLILSLMYTESSIDPMKESNMGACGLMQVRYKIWKEEPELKDNGVDKWHKLFWPEENIKAGTDIFKKFYSESGNNINTTLYRYNSGSPKIPEKPNEEVLKYINKIMYYHYYIQNLVRGNNESSKGFNR